MSNDTKIQDFDQIAVAVLPRTDNPTSDDFLHENIGVMLEHCQGIAWGIAGVSVCKKHPIPDNAILKAVEALDMQINTIQALVDGWMDARRAKS